MVFGKRSIAFVMGLALLSGAVAAQSLTVTPGSGLKAGDLATIEYTNATKANQQVTVTVSGGSPTVVQEIIIQLDAKGRGSGTWLVTTWRAAHFNAPSVQEVCLAISL